MRYMNLPDRFLSWMIPIKSFLQAAAIPAFLSGSGAAAAGSGAASAGGSLLGASAIQAGGNMATGMLGGLLGKSSGEETDKQQAQNLKRKRDILNKWGLPVGQLGAMLGGYSAITGRSSNPQGERARQQGMATGASLMQNQVAPGMPGYQNAKQQSYQQSMQQQGQMTSGDVMGMMWALYLGGKALKG